MNEQRDLKDRVETEVVNYVFSMKVPAKYWDDFYNKADGFFKKYYGDVRWVGLMHLIDKTLEDHRYQLLYDELEAIKAKTQEQKKPEPEQKGVNVVTFGKKRGDYYDR